MKEIPVKKNEEYIVEIIDYGTEGEGIAKIDNFIIFVPGAMKEEKARIKIVKVLSSHAYGKLLDILEKSQNRVEEDCKTYKRCGGCKLRHINYPETLEMKQEKVQNLVNKMLKKKTTVKETIGMEKPFYYRNKLQYPLGLDKNENPIMGVFAERTHEIIPVQTCKIQNPISEQIAKYIYEYILKHHISVYNEKIGKGVLRHIVIKIGIKTNEIMCVLVANEKNIPTERNLVKELTTKFPNIKTIVKNYNPKNTNVILGKENTILYGDGYITDKLGEYTFKISTLSFYQINPIQTEKLYNLGIEKADLTGNEIVLDLYCGIGTIGIFASKKAKKVYGIEIIEQAIEDAKENAKINHIKNIEFHVGDVEKVLGLILEKEKVKPDVIFVDPPRKGLDNTTVENILKVKPKKIVYISCNPATLMRDLSRMEEAYDIKEITPVDMFPYTSHVECCALLELKNCQLF